MFSTLHYLVFYLFIFTNSTLSQSTMTIFRKGLFEADTIPSSDVAQAGEWCAVSP